jgi:putative transcriptional regulator
VHRLAIVVAMLGFAPIGAGPASTITPSPPASTTLAGQLLVAREELRDPRFVRTVIYMLRHDRDGAMGLVVNRPLADVPAAELLTRFGLREDRVPGTIRLHYGGPVEPQRGFVLHTADRMVAESRLVADGIAFTGSPEMLGSIARGTGPRRSLVALGYAGWAPGQLEGEIQRGAWATIPSDAMLLFSDDHERTWERALARRKLRI